MIQKKLVHQYYTKRVDYQTSKPHKSKLFLDIQKRRNVTYSKCLIFITFLSSFWHTKYIDLKMSNTYNDLFCTHHWRGSTVRTQHKPDGRVIQCEDDTNLTADSFCSRRTSSTVSPCKENWDFWASEGRREGWADEKTEGWVDGIKK